MAVNAYMGPAAHQSEWVQSEADRLRSMGDLLSRVTERDLEIALGTLNSGESETAPLRLLDVGAGSASDVRLTTERLGGEYFAYDVNGVLLAANTAPDDHKLYDEKGHVPAPDHSFDVVFARAVAGWNHTPDKLAALVGEMLRVVRPGGMLIVSDFVWSDAGPAGTENGLSVDLALMEAKGAMLMALSSPRAGFDPDFGAKIGRKLDSMLYSDARYSTRAEVRHEFPPDDYRAVLLETAANVLVKLEEEGGGLASVPAAMIRESVAEISGAKHCIITLPTLVTQFIRINPPQFN